MLSLISAGATAQTFNYNSTAPPTWLSVHAHVTALQRPQALSLVGAIVESVKVEPDGDNPWYIWDITINNTYDALDTREVFSTCQAIQNHLAVIGANFGQLIGGTIGARAPRPPLEPEDLRCRQRRFASRPLPVLRRPPRCHRDPRPAGGGRLPPGWPGERAAGGAPPLGLLRAVEVVGGLGHVADHRDPRRLYGRHLHPDQHRHLPVCHHLQRFRASRQKLVPPSEDPAPSKPIAAHQPSAPRREQNVVDYAAATILLDQMIRGTEKVAPCLAVRRALSPVPALRGGL